MEDKIWRQFYLGREDRLWRQQGELWKTKKYHQDIEENSKGIAIIKKENELQDVQIEEIKLSTSNPLGG